MARTVGERSPLNRFLVHVALPLIGLFGLVCLNPTSRVRCGTLVSAPSGSTDRNP